MTIERPMLIVQWTIVNFPLSVVQCPLFIVTCALSNVHCQLAIVKLASRCIILQQNRRCCEKKNQFCHAKSLKLKCERKSVDQNILKVMQQFKTLDVNHFFTDSALWAGSVIESPCPCVCLSFCLSFCAIGCSFFGEVFFTS